MDAVQLAAEILLVVAIILIVESAVLFLRAWALGAIRDCLAYMVLLPGRRNRALGAFSLVTAGFLAATVARLLSVIGLLDHTLAQEISALSFVVGSVALSVLVFVGLDPKHLNEPERLFLDQPSHILYSVGVVDQRESGAAQ